MARHLVYPLAETRLGKPYSYMTSSPQIVQSIYQALEQGKLAKILVLLHEQIVVNQATSLPYGGSFHGREGFISSLTLTLSTWEIYRKVPDVFLTNEEDVAVLGELQLKGRLASELLKLPFVDHWRLQDGKVTEIRMFDWDTTLIVNYLNESESKTSA